MSIVWVHQIEDRDCQCESKNNTLIYVVYKKKTHFKYKDTYRLKVKGWGFWLLAQRGPRCNLLLSLWIWVHLTPAVSTMPPKSDPSEIISAQAPKISPLGLSPKKADGDIVKTTSDWKGLRVMVKLTIHNGQAQTEVVPSASALIVTVLKEALRDRKKQNHPHQQKYI